jgi:hypothetical protein
MRTLPAILVSVALVAAACSDDGSDADAPLTDPDAATSTGDADPDPIRDAGGSAGTPVVGDTGTGGGGRFVRALQPFADCTAFLEHVKAAARERVGPYGLNGGPVYWMEDVAVEEMAMDVAAGGADGDSVAPAATVPASRGDGGFTGTNVQELGVDEPDIVKTDGERILVVSENVLTYVDLRGATPAITDRLVLPEGWGHELFFRGDRALLFTNGGSWGWPMPAGALIDVAAGDADAEVTAPDYQGPAALVIEIDLSDPSNLTIDASMRVEGQYLSARAVGDHVRLAVSSAPDQLPWVYPQNEYGEDRATETNRAIIDESGLEDWIPSYELTSDDVSDGGPLLSCSRMHHPAEFSGFDVISVVDLDLATGLAGGFDTADAVGVLAGGQTVYSSLDRFYVATTKWAGADLATDDSRVREWNDDYETDLHSFALTPGEPTRYVASGTIAGSLLNQFSLDEYQGYLRAITTDGSPWDGGNLSESRLVVLQEQGDRLVHVGEVGGLGRGERLYSARLMDDIGFAVTFRQVDPFYVLDLSDPTDPRLTGELKIPGFSTYLHPLGDHRVLGIGQDATEDGRTTGLKLSMFDVSDPTDPREISVWSLPGASSPAESDHRAFQIWGSTAILPVQTWNQGFDGAILFDLTDGIREIGRVTHLGDGAPSSDCRPIGAADLTEESELYWMAIDGAAHLQLCGADDVGGWGSWYCDPIPAGDLRYWFPDETLATDQLALLGVDDGDRLEICWPDNYRESIQRSLVVDDTLWTMTPSALQGNRLGDLAVVASLGLH